MVVCTVARYVIASGVYVRICTHTGKGVECRNTEEAPVVSVATRRDALEIRFGERTNGACER